MRIVTPYGSWDKDDWLSLKVLGKDAV
jgi:hypothetical protein